MASAKVEELNHWETELSLETELKKILAKGPIKIRFCGYH